MTGPLSVMELTLSREKRTPGLERRLSARQRKSEPSLEDRGPKFYALPQPAFPPKDRDEDGPLYYKRPGIEA